MHPGKYALAILMASFTLLPAISHAVVPKHDMDPLEPDIHRAKPFVTRMARVNGCILNFRRVDQMIPFSTLTGYDPWAVPILGNGDTEGCYRPFRMGGWRQDDKGRLAVTVDFVSPQGHYQRVNYHLQKDREGNFLAVFER